MTTVGKLYQTILSKEIATGAKPSDAQRAALNAAEILDEQPTTAAFLEGERFLSLPTAVRKQKANAFLDMIAAEAGVTREVYLSQLASRLEEALDAAAVTPRDQPIDSEPPIYKLLKTLGQDENRLSEEDTEQVKDAINELGEMTQQDFRLVLSFLDMNNGTYFSVPVQNKIRAFMGITDHALRRSALALEREHGTIDKAGAREILAGIDGTLLGRHRHSLLSLPSACKTTEGAQELLTEKANQLSMKTIISSIVAKGTLTPEAFEKDLVPEIDRQPYTWSDAADLLLEMRFNSEVEMAPETRQGIDARLRARGYPVLSPRDGPTLPTAKLVRDANITAPDHRLADLRRLAGREDTAELIGVIDGGFDVSNPAIKNRFWQNPGEIPGDGIDNDNNGYKDDFNGINAMGLANGRPTGTHSDLYTLGQLTNHGCHVLGIATKGTDDIRAVVGAGGSEHLSECIDYAVERGAKVINISQAVHNPEEIANVLATIDRHPDVLFVESAGNNGKQLGVQLTPEKELSANDRPNFIRVAAASEHGDKLNISNYGKPHTTLAAKCKFLSTAAVGRQDRATGEGLFYYSGATSQASPNVANLAVKCRLLAPNLEPEALKKLLIDTTTPLDNWSELVLSGGLVDDERAMSLAAAIGLVRDGKTPEDAVQQLEISGGLRTFILEKLPEYAG